jgi:hypothetical protein
MVVATALVLLFMLVYYRFAGLVADLAVLLNILLVVAVMISIKAAFTLAGLAGLVLSVGMGVAAGLSACVVLFGKVHLMTLVFGASLVGVAEVLAKADVSGAVRSMVMAAES